MQLYPFQAEGVKFLGSRKRALLSDQPGLGKTPQALCALPSRSRSLAVVPSCVKYNWQNECRQWRPDLSPVVLSGRESFRWPADGELVITNFDVLPEWAAPKASKPTEWPTLDHVAQADREAAAGVQLIVDEAHRLKNAESIRSQRVAGLSELCSGAWGLTGTPLLNHPADLWGILSVLKLEKEAFESYGNFCRLFSMSKSSRGSAVWGLPDRCVPGLLRRVLLRRLREEVLPQLPRKTYTILEVNGVSDSLRSMLDKLYQEWESVLLSNVLPPFEHFAEARSLLAASRIEALLEYVEDCEDQEVPLVVFSAHRLPIEALEKREGWATVTGRTGAAERQRIVEKFQAGELRGVGLTIAAGGVGITLTRAWRELFVDLAWTPADNAQAEDRICRIGQTASACEYVRMVSNHPLDYHILRVLSRKIELAYATLDA